MAGREIVASVRTLVTADIESGHTATVDDLNDDASSRLEMGIAGINIEDGLVTDRTLRDPEQQAERLHAVRAAADHASVRLWINARTDTYRTGAGTPHERINATMARAVVSAAAGADSLFIPGVVDISVIRELTTGPLPINVMAGLVLRASSCWPRPMSRASASVRRALRQVWSERQSWLEPTPQTSPLGPRSVPLGCRLGQIQLIGAYTACTSIDRSSYTVCAVSPHTFLTVFNLLGASQDFLRYLNIPVRYPEPGDYSLTNGVRRSTGANTRAAHSCSQHLEASRLPVATADLELYPPSSKQRMVDGPWSCRSWADLIVQMCPSVRPWRDCALAFCPLLVGFSVALMMAIHPFYPWRAEYAETHSPIDVPSCTTTLSHSALTSLVSARTADDAEPPRDTPRACRRCGSDSG